MSVRLWKNISPKIAKSAYIDSSAEIIGNVVIGEFSSIWCLTVIRGDVNKIRIGARSNIQDNSVLHVTHSEPENDDPGFPLIIGDGVTVGHRAILHGCELQDNSFVGMGAIIMDGAVVESEAMVGAGALVTAGTVVKKGKIFVGNPAKLMRKLRTKEIDAIYQSAENYVCYAKDYL